MTPDTDANRIRDLLVAGPAPPERADAAHNRRKILAIAAERVAAHGVEALSLNELAHAAGVGVGTVYRRFGDRAGLLHAMMVEHERAFQEAFTTGPPPLGPGAPPVERIRAFLHAYAEVLETYATLMAAAEAAMTNERRYGVGAYATHHAHLAKLIAQARPDTDATYLADALLASLAAGLFVHQRQARGMSLDDIKTGLDTVLRGVDQPSSHQPES